MRCDECDDGIAMQTDPVTGLNYHRCRDPISGRKTDVVCTAQRSNNTPLGQSNDDSEAVRLEIRAAELAGYAVTHRGSSIDLHMDRMTDEEWQGAWRHNGEHMLGDGLGFQAGHLARCIVEHEEES